MERQGHPRFYELIDELAAMHAAKNAGYAGSDNPDPLANFRKCEKFGISAFQGCLVRLSDKFARVTNLAKKPTDEQVGESITDTLKDLASYALLAICLYEEEPQEYVPDTLSEQGFPAGIPSPLCGDDVISREAFWYPASRRPEGKRIGLITDRENLAIARWNTEYEKWEAQMVLSGDPVSSVYYWTDPQAVIPVP